MQKLPDRIIYPTDYLPVPNTHQQKNIDQFLVDLEMSLEIKHEKVSFNDVWRQSPPPEANGLDLEEFMKNVSILRFAGL